VFHDIFAGDGGPPHYPVPWAEEPSISFLMTPARVREILEGLGFVVRDWVDTSEASLRWAAGAVARLESSAPPRLGTHVLMGENARAKLGNVLRNLREQRLVVVQARAELR
jgi:hypothetical protein